MSNIKKSWVLVPVLIETSEDDEGPYVGSVTQPSCAYVQSFLTLNSNQFDNRENAESWLKNQEAAEFDRMEE